MTESHDQLKAFEEQGRITTYTYYDKGMLRIHQWGSGPNAKFAIGHGPIKDITREEAERLFGTHLP